jgi:homoserine dehydrogenase
MRIAFVGFGHVGQAFADLLAEKRDMLRRQGISPLVTGICTRRQGGIIREIGINPVKAARLLESGQLLTRLPHDQHIADSDSFVRRCPADVIFEISTLNYRNGEPALSHIEAALSTGKHVVTANKGPIACAFDRLRRLAVRQRKQLRFEGSVMDGLPVFSLVEKTLPCTRIFGFRGILNSTTNYILTEMQQGTSFRAALEKAKKLGVAEADPRADLEGWDAAAKVAALANVWLRASITPAQVRRQGINEAIGARLTAAMKRGGVIRLVAGAEEATAGICAFVRPQYFPGTHHFAQVQGFSSILEIDTDTMNTITLIENNPGVRQTAYALLSDLVAVCR